MPIGDYLETNYTENTDVTPQVLNNNEDKTKELDDWAKAHEADYEYQNPTIVGTQIQLTKKSNTNRLFFILTADLMGGEITISLDGGATSKPLRNVDGAAINELKKGFVEVIANAAFFTLRPRGGGSIKSVQQGTVTLTVTSLNIPIEEVDITKSVILIDTGTGSYARYTAVQGEIINPTTINLSSAAQNSSTCKWTVIEFENVRTLQKITQSAASVTIESVDITKTMLFVSGKLTNSTSSLTMFYIYASFNSSTSVTVTDNLDVFHLQIIEFE